MSESETAAKVESELSKVTKSSSLTKKVTASKANDLTETKTESASKTLSASQTSNDTSSKLKGLGGSRNKMTTTLSVEFSDGKVIGGSGAKILTTSAQNILSDTETNTIAGSALMEQTDFDKPKSGSTIKGIADSKMNALSTSTIKLIPSLTKNSNLSGSGTAYVSKSKEMTGSATTQTNGSKPKVAIRAKIDKKGVASKSKKRSSERRKRVSDSKSRSHSKGKGASKTRSRSDSKSKKIGSKTGKTGKQSDAKGKKATELKKNQPPDTKSKQAAASKTKKLVETKTRKLADSKTKTSGSKASKTAGSSSKKAVNASAKGFGRVKELISASGSTRNSNDFGSDIGYDTSSSESSGEEVDKTPMVKQNARPFNVGEKRCEGKISQVPGPGTYSIGGIRKQMEFNYSFNGKKTMVPAVEIKCTENNMDKCNVCGKTPFGDYWHFSHIEFMCRGCMEKISSRKMHPTQRLKILAFRKIRDCSAIHRHEGTRAKIMLADQRQIKKLQVKETYLTQYY